MAAQMQVNATQRKNSSRARNYIFAVGRRKESVARVRLYNPASGKIEAFGVERKKGDVVVNGKPINEYFAFKAYGPIYTKLINATDASKFVISAKVAGGGISGQLEAFLHGLARALDKMDSEKYHEMLSTKGYLTRDSRTRERRKVGNAGKARRKKSSPKR